MGIVLLEVIIVGLLVLIIVVCGYVYYIVDVNCGEVIVELFC